MWGRRDKLGVWNQPMHNAIYKTDASTRTYCTARGGCCTLSHVLLFAAPWTVAHRAPLPMEFFMQEHWSGLPFPPQGSSWPRDQTCVSCVSCIDRWILYQWATWETHSTGNSTQYSTLTSMGEKSEKYWWYVYVSLNHFYSIPATKQHCKSAILQYKMKIKLKI